ncbi:MAG: hypothetical protein ACQ9ET_02895 [Nitrosomonadaceae bacterium]
MNRVNFIHIPKNGGMTIRHCPELKSRILLSSPNRHISPEYTKTLLAQMNKYGEHHGYEHARWRDLNKAAHAFKSFAVVRNPWSKVVSRYTFLMHLFDKGNERVIQSPHYSQKPFEEFLEERLEWGNRDYFWHRAIRGWFNQKDHVTDADGNLQVDVLRLEHLNKDINKYFNLNISLRSRNVSNIAKKDYRDFYTPETKKIVEDWYADDIEFFGFTFDGEATKNIWNK